MTRIVVLLAALLLPVGSAPVLHGQSKSDDPLTVYKEYLAALARASTLESLLPYYSKQVSNGLGQMPKEMQGNYLKMNKRVLTDVKVLKQDVTATRARYEMSAKDASGQELKGSATLIKEDGAWKVDDFAWIGPPPQ